MADRIVGALRQKGTWKRSAHVLAALAGLSLFSACGPAPVMLPGPYGEPKPFALTPQERQEIPLMAHANAIARMCPGQFQINRAVRDKILEPLVERAQASGKVFLTAEELVGMPRAEARAMGLAYEKQRGIETYKRETWCAAGRYEVSNRTSVGKYLIGAGA